MYGTIHLTNYKKEKEHINTYQESNVSSCTAGSLGERAPRRISEWHLAQLFPHLRQMPVFWLHDEIFFVLRTWFYLWTGYIVSIKSLGRSRLFSLHTGECNRVDVRFRHPKCLRWKVMSHRCFSSSVDQILSSRIFYAIIADCPAWHRPGERHTLPRRMKGAT